MPDFSPAYLLAWLLRIWQPDLPPCWWITKGIGQNWVDCGWGGFAGLSKSFITKKFLVAAPIVCSTNGWVSFWVGRLQFRDFPFVLINHQWNSKNICSWVKFEFHKIVEGYSRDLSILTASFHKWVSLHLFLLDIPLSARLCPTSDLGKTLITMLLSTLATLRWRCFLSLLSRFTRFSTHVRSFTFKIEILNLMAI